MTTHLEDHEVAAVLAGEDVGVEARNHLASCLSCRTEIAELEALVRSRRAELEAGAPDWRAQQHAVMDRLAGDHGPAARSRRVSRPLLAAAAAVLAVIGLSELRTPSPPVPAAGGQEIEIEEILAEVDAVLEDDSLPRFESIDPGFDDPQSILDNGAS